MNQFLFLLQTWSDERMAAELEALGSNRLWVDFGLPFALFLVGAAIVVAVVMSLLNMVKNPEALKGFLIGLAVLAVLFFIGFALSNGDVPLGYEDVATAQTSKMIGAGIWTVGILMLVGLAFLIFDLVRGLFKI